MAPRLLAGFAQQNPEEAWTSMLSGGGSYPDRNWDAGDIRLLLQSFEGFLQGAEGGQDWATMAREVDAIQQLVPERGKLAERWMESDPEAAVKSGRLRSDLFVAKVGV